MGKLRRAPKPPMSREHMCGRKWRPGTVKDCPRRKNHAPRNKPQGGWRISISDDERIGK